MTIRRGKQDRTRHRGNVCEDTGSWPPSSQGERPQKEPGLGLLAFSPVRKYVSVVLCYGSSSKLIVSSFKFLTPVCLRFLNQKSQVLPMRSAPHVLSLLLSSPCRTILTGAFCPWPHRLWVHLTLQSLWLCSPFLLSFPELLAKWKALVRNSGDQPWIIHEGWEPEIQAQWETMGGGSPPTPTHVLNDLL